MTKRSTTSRRTFFTQSAGAAASLIAAPYFPWTERAFANESANDRPGIGCIGVGSMGSYDATEHAKFGDILAVCDVDSKHAESAKHHEQIGRGKADVYDDYRKLLERDDIDVVSVVTPDHWHVRIAIAALMAGKHVFCQKPLTLTLEENQLVREACQKYDDRVFVVGTQQRGTAELFLRAVNMVQKGLLGEIKNITVGINGGDVGGPFKTKTPPPELDWNQWLGQAAAVDYIPERCHYQFRWWYEYSGGKFTDWGAHHVDIALWALGLDKEGTGPVEFDGTDAKHPVPYQDGYATVDNAYNTAHDFAVKCKFPSGANMTIDSRSENGILFEGDKGRMFVNRGRITGKPIEENWDKGQFTDDDLRRFYKDKPFEGHKQNFYRCVREGGLPVSDVYSHVMTMNTCHLAAIAARLGRVVKWDPTTETIVGDEQAAAFIGREPRTGYEIPLA